MILGFTLANGQPIICMIIVTAKRMKGECNMGFDPFVEWIGEKKTIEKNMDEGKVYPMGLVYMFNRKNVPCFCCCSDSDSITGKLLVESSRLLIACKYLIAPLV